MIRLLLVCVSWAITGQPWNSVFTECSRDKPPFSFVRGQDSTMWDIVWVSPQGHRSVSVSRHFLPQALQCPCLFVIMLQWQHCEYVDVCVCGMQGANMVEMVKAFEWLKEDVINHNHDVCFAGDTVDVLFHAQHMLNDRLVTMSPSPDLAAMLWVHLITFVIVLLCFCPIS